MSFETENNNEGIEKVNVSVLKTGTV